MSLRRVAVPAAVGAAAGAAYWFMMSPYSQAIGPFPYRGPDNRRTVALTFDDGPNEPYTSELADYLERERIPATFFQVGRAVQRHPDVTKRLVDAGHVVGLHGHTHEFTRYLRARSLAAELDQGMAAFAEVGLRPALYRPPWLLRIPALPGLLDQHGLRVISGEFCHLLEVAQPSPESIARQALRSTRSGSITIFHDGFDGKGGDRAATVAAVKLLVPRLREQGYDFTTVDHLLGLPAYQ
ncbi:peptidoglycan/xylan/chitin deacetylase (PgdA/CDA1 family) [Kribbella aluminosa]|uniref:Peptidoglycan/xylan/chitin deacetylase (PgdA/CDA1 family) n=1 Tax=Kribbella aluminosa TaxID=416017 RepID=A0ABS4UVB2_9ACTN|nr:polysaccharide deacetylase family protein [Kribbella aluminosa]MBP2355577.1 peptidoglycan/xylan/chitin deacetylase (PgdA/CDA1 family) [Kribbella aluminosa]